MKPARATVKNGTGALVQRVGRWKGKQLHWGFVFTPNLSSFWGPLLTSLNSSQSKNITIPGLTVWNLHTERTWMIFQLLETHRSHYAQETNQNPGDHSASPPYSLQKLWVRTVFLCSWIGRVQCPWQKPKQTKNKQTKKT